jgi:hypothetical protein
MTNADTHRFIRYDAKPAGQDLRPYVAPKDATNKTGTVDMKEYLKWLRSAGYCFAGDRCDF